MIKYTHKRGRQHFLYHLVLCDKTTTFAGGGGDTGEEE
jgi:hypothetical protein